MKEIDVYQQYFEGRCVFNGVKRHAVSVTLTAAGGEGTIRYEAGVAFFPHTAEDDYAVSYDAVASRELYAAPGRRSKKREARLMEEKLHEAADAAAAELGGEIFWDRPLRDARYG